MHVLIQLPIVIGSQGETSKCYHNFYLNQMTSGYINYNQYIQTKIKNKLYMKAIYYACFKWE